MSNLSKREYLEHLKLEAIRLRSLKSEISKELYNYKGELIVDVKYRLDYNEETKEKEYNNTVSMYFTLNACCEEDERKSLFNTNIIYDGVYINKYKINKRIFSNLSKNLFIIHFWPYVRELAQSITGRMGIRPFLLPPLGQLIKKDD